MYLVAFLGIDFDAILQKIVDWFFNLWYYIDITICRLLALLYSIFEVFVGSKQVTFNGSSSYLLDVFFGNSTISKIYWGMAIIGIVLAFVFTIIGVTKKVFDADEKVKSSIGGMIRKLIQSVLMIILMNFLILVVLNATNVLTEQVTLIFDYGSILGEAQEYNFKPADYAAMARIFDTIGSYSLNDSRESRYNVNACFNDIRSDLKVLDDNGVFEFTYDDNTWQGVLRNIATCHDLDEDQELDENNTELNDAIINAMVMLETNESFQPVATVKREDMKLTSETVPLDVIVFHMGLMDHAKNSKYNTNASMYDGLRYDYVTGKKSIYTLSTVRRDFDINNMGCHIIIILSGLLVAWEFLKITLNCVARIFNMILLYISFPPFAATLPMDEGAKMKQWTTAFIIQSLSVFGTLLAVRLLMIMIPIIFSSELVLFENAYINALAKLAFLIGLSFTTEKASSMITGILADQAGFQAVQASNSGSAAAGAVASAGAAIGQKAYGMASKPVGAVMGAIGGGASAIASRAGRGMGKLTNWAGNKINESNSTVARGLRATGRGLSAVGRGFSAVGGAISSAYHGTLDFLNPAKASADWQRGSNRDRFENDLKKQGDEGNRARDLLYNMDQQMAQDAFGMDGAQLNGLKLRTGLGDSQNPEAQKNAQELLSGINTKQDAAQFGMNMKQVNALKNQGAGGGGAAMGRMAQLPPQRGQGGQGGQPQSGDQKKNLSNSQEQGGQQPDPQKVMGANAQGGPVQSQNGPQKAMGANVQGGPVQSQNGPQKAMGANVQNGPQVQTQAQPQRAMGSNFQNAQSQGQPAVGSNFQNAQPQVQPAVGSNSQNSQPQNQSVVGGSFQTQSQAQPQQGSVAQQTGNVGAQPQQGSVVQQTGSVGAQPQQSFAAHEPTAAQVPHRAVVPPKNLEPNKK